MKQVEHSEMSMININQDDHGDNRAFGYVLNKKRAKAKLLKGANRESHLNIEHKLGCVNLRFSNGAYFQLVLPLLKDWHEKIDCSIKINDVEIKNLEVDVGLDKVGQHMDTKMVVIANDDRLVLHAYNGTQNLMVQGRNYEHFALNNLEPFFRKDIETKIDIITSFNDKVKETLGVKKVTKKSTKPFKCPQCGVNTSTIGDLKLHMKRCHTKPGIDSPIRKKVITTPNENISMLDISGVKMIEGSTEAVNESLETSRKGKRCWSIHS